jgi:hypothetical protein
MKRLTTNKPAILNRVNVKWIRNLIPAIFIILLLAGFTSRAQTLPVVSVRFANPVYDCPTQIYCLDVEFKSDTPDQKLFGMNLRFFYDDNILEYVGTSDFAEGYSMPGDPEIQNVGGAFLFGITGPLEWFNGQVQLTSSTSVVLPTDGWVKLFRICFHVDDPAYVGIQNFCATIVWDLQENPPETGGGFQWGDDGVVMTVAGLSAQQSLPTTEEVVQFNWTYGGNPEGFGHPVSTVCIKTTCGYYIPVSNWSLYLAISLMVVATVFIYRRRMS